MSEKRSPEAGERTSIHNVDLSSVHNSGKSMRSQHSSSSIRSQRIKSKINLRLAALASKQETERLEEVKRQAQAKAEAAKAEAAKAQARSRSSNYK